MHLKKRMKASLKNRHLPIDLKAIPATVAPFGSNDEILESVLLVLRVREALGQDASVFPEEESEKFRSRRKLERTLTALLHNRIRLTSDTVSLAGIFLKYRLSQLEQEILLTLLLDPLGLWESRISSVADVIRVLSLEASQTLSVLRSLSEGGRLHRQGLIHSDDLDEPLRERSLGVEPALVEMVLAGREGRSKAFKLSTMKDLDKVLARITRALQQKSEELDNVFKGYSKVAEFLRWERRVKALLCDLDGALTAHSEWKLTQVRRNIPRLKDWIVFLTLLGKCFGCLASSDNLFKGAGLARASCSSPEEYPARLNQLLSTAPLLKGEFIRPCGGMGSFFEESTEAVQETEYELTDKALQSLDMEKKRRRDVLKGKDVALQEPRLRLADLVLSPKTLEAIQLALDHVKGNGTLMQKWGLGSTFPYGTGVTMLFYGPPGTGKTATAEAIACELNKPLLVADYSKIQNCFVGQTEKNIVGTFHKARQYDAVLFWDEADAMFFDRDMASRAWEVRDVNVLLQEMERFEGVCILATNRKTVLDRALERRITAKVEFPRPSRDIRANLWRALLPPTMPRCENMDYDLLSHHDLSGGEIKNVILNAARLAYGRSRRGPVTMGDFEKAIGMEVQGGWSKANRQAAGFRKD